MCESSYIPDLTPLGMVVSQSMLNTLWLQAPSMSKKATKTSALISTDWLIFVSKLPQISIQTLLDFSTEAKYGYWSTEFKLQVYQLAGDFITNAVKFMVVLMNGDPSSYVGSLR